MLSRVFPPSLCALLYSGSVSGDTTLHEGKEWGSGGKGGGKRSGGEGRGKGRDIYDIGNTN